MDYLKYYKVLGIKENATKEEIRNAYLREMKKYHPDIYQGDKKYAEDKAKQINEAYEILMNKKDNKSNSSQNSVKTTRTHPNQNYNNKKPDYINELFTKYKPYLNNVNFITEYIKKYGSNVYMYLPDNLRKIPSILTIAILKFDKLHNYEYNNPINYALNEAFTIENVKLAIKIGIINFDDFYIFLKSYNNNIIDLSKRYNAFLTCKYVAITFMEKYGSNIYRFLSDELRSDEEVLKIAILYHYKSYPEYIEFNPLDFALSNSLTPDNIILAIKKELITDKNIEIIETKLKNNTNNQNNPNKKYF